MWDGLQPVLGFLHLAMRCRDLRFGTGAAPFRLTRASIEKALVISSIIFAQRLPCNDSCMALGSWSKKRSTPRRLRRRRDSAQGSVLDRGPHYNVPPRRGGGDSETTHLAHFLSSSHVVYTVQSRAISNFLFLTRLPLYAIEPTRRALPRSR
jgi:hypothetical protein